MRQTKGNKKTFENSQKTKSRLSKCGDGDIWWQLLSSHFSALSQLGCPFLKKTKQKHTDILVYLHIYLQINHPAQQFCISSSTTSVASWWWKQSGKAFPSLRADQYSFSTAWTAAIWMMWLLGSNKQITYIQIENNSKEKRVKTISVEHHVTSVWWGLQRPGFPTSSGNYSCLFNMMKWLKKARCHCCAAVLPKPLGVNVCSCTDWLQPPIGWQCPCCAAKTTLHSEWGHFRAGWYGANVISRYSLAEWRYSICIDILLHYIFRFLSP